MKCLIKFCPATSHTTSWPGIICFHTKKYFCNCKNHTFQEKKKKQPLAVLDTDGDVHPQAQWYACIIPFAQRERNNQPKNLKGLKKKPKGKNGQQKVLSHNLYSYVRLSPADGQAFSLALI